MYDLKTVLDNIADDLAKENPELSDAEISLATVRLKVTVLYVTLSEIGIQGKGLNDDQLFGVTTGLVELSEWMLSREMLIKTMPQIEAELNGDN